jgi:hypothetical protein
MNQKQTMVHGATASYLSSVENAGLSLLEYLTAEGRKTCPNRKAPILLSAHKKTKESFLVRTACKLWRCAVCRYNNAKKWIAKILNGVNTIGGRWFFATITPHESWKKRGGSLKNLRTNFHKLLKRIRRMVGDFHYLKVYEKFKKGGWHLHLILDAELPYVDTGKTDKQGFPLFKSQWLKDNAKSSGLGFIADFQPIRSPAGTAYYCAKYLVKGFSLGDDWPKHLHRIQVSQNWPKLPELVPSGDYDWYYTSGTGELLRIARELQLEGFHFTSNFTGERLSLNALLQEYLDNVMDRKAIRERAISNAHSVDEYERTVRTRAAIKQKVQPYIQQSADNNQHARYTRLFKAGNGAKRVGQSGRLLPLGS